MSNLLSIYKNNSKTIVVDVTDSDGSVFNCSGYTPVFSVKKKPDDISFVINLNGSLSGITNSTLIFPISTTNTDLNEGEYWYDVTLTKSGEAITIVYDRLKILQNVKYGD
jgi:hypothetical protein